MPAIEEQTSADFAAARRAEAQAQFDENQARKKEADLAALDKGDLVTRQVRVVPFQEYPKMLYKAGKVRAQAIDKADEKQKVKEGWSLTLIEDPPAA